MTSLIDMSIFINLKLIYTICKRNDDYIYSNLIEYFIRNHLKRLYVCYEDNNDIKLYILKLMKIQFKFFTKEIRAGIFELIKKIIQC